MLWVLVSQVSETEDDDSAETLDAVESQVQRRLAELERQVASVAAKTSEARQKRRALLADITTYTGEEATHAASMQSTRPLSAIVKTLSLCDLC